MTPPLLILETSGRSGLVALAAGPDLLAQRRLDEGRKHSRDLVSTIADLLTGQGWAARDLAAVIVSRGPGSYTGLRVGLMAAKTLAYATGCALIAIDTFAAVARQAPAGVNCLDVIGDAQKENVYVQSFARAGEEWRPVADLAIRPFGDWLSQRQPDAWVSGPGLARWEAHLPAGVPRVDASARQPGAASLLALGLARLLAGQRDDPCAAEPLYLRPSSAETQWGSGTGR
jgi:tRNA threonylcarbamoyladenosine biosynthesis protein TsaB